MTGQVLQRNAGGRGGAQVTGSSRANGDVELRVLKGNRVARGHDWRVAGWSEAREFRAELAGLRTGGPYRIELRIMKGDRIVDGLAVDDVFVGDVWILAGQSNMEGIGNLVHAPRPHPKVRAFYMRDEWGIAEEPIHFLGEAVDTVHNGYGDGPDRPSCAVLTERRASFVKGMSPGHVFALEMLKRTRIPQGLIACAHGGTSMTQWSPALRDEGGASLYGAMLRRYHKLGQPVAGVLWYQGESDANREAAAVYTRNMQSLVAATRRDMGLPTLPWLVVQLGCHAAREDGEAWNSVQEQQRQLPEVIEHLDVAPAIDLELDDGIHIGGKGHRVLGRRLARLADRLVHRTPGAKPGIRVRKIELVPTPHSRPESLWQSVQITYGNVVGRLRSDGRPTGFALLDDGGRDLQAIYKTTIAGRSVTLHTTMSAYELSILNVSYGHGRCPVCNITDSDGMSIPVMQAVRIDPEHARCCVNWQTARLPGAASVAAVGYETARAVRGWRKAPPREGFGVLPKSPDLDKTGVYAMRTTLTAHATLEALIIFGANSPFKIWLNGRPVLKDLTAGIPIDPGQYKAVMKLREGENSLMVAFAPRSAGAHIGICARVGTLAEKVDERIE
jgi:hypothetical protein